LQFFRDANTQRNRGGTMFLALEVASDTTRRK